MEFGISEVISLLALLVSGVAIVVSYKTAIRDDGKLEVTFKTYIYENEDGVTKTWGHALELKNYGRKPVIIRAIKNHDQEISFEDDYVETDHGLSKTPISFPLKIDSCESQILKPQEVNSDFKISVIDGDGNKWPAMAATERIYPPRIVISAMG